MIKTEIIEALVPLKDPALIAMLAHFAEIHHYKKGEHIYDVGDMQKKIYILWSGILYRPPKVRPKNLTIGGRYFYG